MSLLGSTSPHSCFHHSTLLLPPPPYLTSISAIAPMHASPVCTTYRSLLVSPSLALSPILLPLPSRVRSVFQAHSPPASLPSDPQRNNSCRDIGHGGVQQPSSDCTPRRKAVGVQGEHCPAVVTEKQSGCVSSCASLVCTLQHVHERV